MKRIAYTDDEGEFGMVDDGEGLIFWGPLPPNAAEYREIYERLIAEGVVPEPYGAEI